MASLLSRVAYYETSPPKREMNDEKRRPLVFISWSGDVSRQVALAIRELLRQSIMTADPWMSESDIDGRAMEV
jgi:hypothetical protein